MRTARPRHAAAGGTARSGCLPRGGWDRARAPRAGKPGGPTARRRRPLLQQEADTRLTRARRRSRSGAGWSRDDRLETTSLVVEQAADNASDDAAAALALRIAGHPL